MYRNWLGLMQGGLQARVDKAQNHIIRRLNADRQYRTLNGARNLSCPGRSLMLVRNVGHHMMSGMKRH